MLINHMGHQHLLDTQGLCCPEPVMLLHKAIREIAVGEIVKVVATDPSTQRDIPKFCQFLNHELVEKTDEQNGTVFVYYIRKSEKK